MQAAPTLAVLRGGQRQGPVVILMGLTIGFAAGTTSMGVMGVFFAVFAGTIGREQSCGQADGSSRAGHANKDLHDKQEDGDHMEGTSQHI